MTAGLLAGVRVLSVAEQYPGPYATLVLADLGADVVQVERPLGGDPARQFPAFYEALNRNKRSLVLDLKSPTGVERFLDLAAESDVIVEGFRPGTVDRLGIGYQNVLARNADVIYVSISGFGQFGPYRDKPGHDLSYLALAGLIGNAQRETLAQLQVADLSAGMFAAIACLLGLFHRERTGDGLYVDVSMFDVLVSLASTNLVPLANNAQSTTFLESPAYGTFQTADGTDLVIAIAHEDSFWRRLCNVLGLLEYADLTMHERTSRSDELRRAIADAVLTKTREEWLALMGRADLPVAPVQSPHEVLGDPHLAARNLLVSVASQGKVRRYVRQPLVIPGFAYTPVAHGPTLGEHTPELIEGGAT